MKEIFEDLGVGNLQILQAEKGYRFTSDAVVLANFVSAGKNDTVVELGVGSGVISTLINFKEKPKQIYGFEIQKTAFERAVKSLEKNKLKNITFFNEDFLNYKKYIKSASAEVVVCNPPYKKVASGALPQNKEIVISKTEVKSNLEQIVWVASKMLKVGAKFYVCQTPKRTAELIETLKKHNLEPKRMFFSHPAKDKNASCVFVECVKGAKEQITILPPLITHDDKGDYVSIIRKFYKEKVWCYILLVCQLAI